jgi:hypothetical protein
MEGMSLMSEEPPSPGEGGGEEGPPVENGPPMFESGEGLCLLPPVFLNWNSASLSITNAESGGIYDVFATTNLTLMPAAPELNLTNWVWVLRTDAGQTNDIVVTNLWPDAGFFRLGTMLDSDGDGLTDAYELLVSHTDPDNPDTDGDGLSDGWEVEHGMNPLVDESAQTSGRLNYQYDASGWLRVVSGARSEDITPDNEGNVQTAQ